MGPCDLLQYEWATSNLNGSALIKELVNKVWGIKPTSNSLVKSSNQTIKVNGLMTLYFVLSCIKNSNIFASLISSQGIEITEEPQLNYLQTILPSERYRFSFYHCKPSHTHCITHASSSAIITNESFQQWTKQPHEKSMLSNIFGKIYL